MIPKPDENCAELPRTLVLDTNVCLDLFVFRDPRWDALLSALRQAQVRAWTRADCRMEWMLVLAYTKLGLDADQQGAALSEFDQLITLFPTDPMRDGMDSDTASLPLCRDPDDQKFIALAAQCGADALVTKDKLVLKLARKMKKRALFRILSPEQWTAEWLAGLAGPSTPGRSTPELPTPGPSALGPSTLGPSTPGSITPDSSALAPGHVTGDAATLQ